MIPRADNRALAGSVARHAGVHADGLGRRLVLLVLVVVVLLLLDGLVRGDGQQQLALEQRRRRVWRELEQLGEGKWEPLLPLVVLERLRVQILLGLPRVLLVRELLPLDEHPAIRALPHLPEQRLDAVVAVALRIVRVVHDALLRVVLAVRLRPVTARRLGGGAGGGGGGGRGAGGRGGRGRDGWLGGSHLGLLARAVGRGCLATLGELRRVAGQRAQLATRQLRGGLLAPPAQPCLGRCQRAAGCESVAAPAREDVGLQAARVAERLVRVARDPLLIKRADERGVARIGGRALALDGRRAAGRRAAALASRLGRVRALLLLLPRPLAGLLLLLLLRLLRLAPFLLRHPLELLVVLRLKVADHLRVDDVRGRLPRVEAVAPAHPLDQVLDAAALAPALIDQLAHLVDVLVVLALRRALLALGVGVVASVRCRGVFQGGSRGSGFGGHRSQCVVRRRVGGGGRRRRLKRGTATRRARRLRCGRRRRKRWRRLLLWRRRLRRLLRRRHRRRQRCRPRRRLARPGGSGRRACRSGGRHRRSWWRWRMVDGQIR